MRRILTAVGAVAVLGVGGGAIAGAATEERSGRERASTVFVERLAEQLDVSEGALRKATIAAGTDTIEELRATGRLDSERAERMQQRLEKRGGAPFTRLSRRADGGAGARRAGLDAVAQALGVERANLVRELREGTPPATIIERRGEDREQVAAAVRKAVAGRLAQRRVPAERAARRTKRLAERLTGTEALRGGRG